jgi:hypothetical protein
MPSSHSELATTRRSARTARENQRRRPQADLEKKRNARAFGQLDVASATSSGLTQLQAIESLPENSTQEIAAKANAYHAFLEQAKTSRLAHAADLLVGAFLLPKQEGAEASIPTTATLYLTLLGEVLPATQQGALAAAQAACTEARVFHWPLAFPQVFASGGFDCVLGNPPWERIKLQEEEFFATRHRDVAEAKNKAERSQRIQWLSEGMLAKHLFPSLDHAAQQCSAEQRLYADFLSTRRTAEAASMFAHVNGSDGGRYPLTGVGDVNTYALFAETISQITHESGRAGFIVPTGIATDDSTKAYFSYLTQNSLLVRLQSFENEEFIFPSVHHSFRFCMLTLGKSDQADFVFFARQPSQIHDPRRRFTLTPEEFKLINPNTLTCPVFRSEKDAELTKKLYRMAPVLINEDQKNGNSWGIFFMTMLHMSGDSHLFVNADGDGLLPLYEAKMIHQFDHRWATYMADGESRDVTGTEKSDPDFTVIPRYWVNEVEVDERLTKRDRDGNLIWRWERGWLMGWRDVTSAHVFRTAIASVVPRVGVGHTLPLFMTNHDAELAAALLANINSLVLDFIARVKVGGTHLTYGYLKQFPIIPPSRYQKSDIAFIVTRVLELTYTAHDLSPWAKDLNYHGRPFAFNAERRAMLRAELDAYYAKLYGLTRDELRYILDPTDIMGEDYPSESFRVLKNKEQKEFCEYRTQRLVLEAWDKLESGKLH